MSRVPEPIYLLTAATTTGADDLVRKLSPLSTFQAKGTTTAGAGAAAIAVQVSNDGINWLTLGTISLTLSTTESSDGFASEAAWVFVRGNVTSISGTGASVSLVMGM